MQKKYLDRPSPPLPANEHCDEKARGNDGQIYVSVKNVKGVCRWVLAEKVGGVKKGGRISKKSPSPKVSKKISRKPSKGSKKIRKTTKKVSRSPRKGSKKMRKTTKKVKKASENVSRKTKKVLRFAVK